MKRRNLKTKKRTYKRQRTYRKWRGGPIKRRTYKKKKTRRRTRQSGGLIPAGMRKAARSLGLTQAPPAAARPETDYTEFYDEDANVMVQASEKARKKDAAAAAREAMRGWSHETGSQENYWDWQLRIKNITQEEYDKKQEGAAAAKESAKNSEAEMWGDFP